MKAAEPLAEEISLTTGGIPIRNLWHMLLYAWNEVVLKNQWQAEPRGHLAWTRCLLHFWRS